MHSRPSFIFRNLRVSPPRSCVAHFPLQVLSGFSAAYAARTLERRTFHRALTLYERSHPLNLFLFCHFDGVNRKVHKCNRVVIERSFSCHIYPLSLQTNTMEGVPKLHLSSWIWNRKEKAMTRSYWVPQYRWQLQEWIETWCQRTGTPLPKALRKKKKRHLYALYFQISGIDKRTAGDGNSQ